MGFKTKTKIANRKNYGSKRNTNVIKFLVYHYTGNDGDTDEANANYFHNNVVKTSAHRFVDDDSVTISVPDNYVAWHCGGGIQGNGGHKYHKICTNTNSIGIEMCDTIKNGKYEVSTKTRTNAIELGRELIEKYGITKEHVIRHYDVTGKICPAYFVKDEEAWNDFKNELFSENKPTQISQETYKKGNYKTLYVMKVRTGAGTEFRQKKKKELTVDGRKNATITGCYKQGTVFTALEIIDRGNNEYWARTPSGYICIRDRKQEYCKKI